MVGSMPSLLLRAIITGFGYKIGAELARYVSERVGLKKPDPSPEQDDGVPSGMTGEPGDDDDLDEADDRRDDEDDDGA